jgi:RNA polymerase subunit RPABC4/transcription elongation factor Spt4
LKTMNVHRRCSHCGTLVPLEAERCPRCGRPVPQVVNTGNVTAVLIVLSAIALVVVTYMLAK